MKYAVTTKKTRKPISKEHYLDYLDSLTDIGKVYNVVFETTKGLHIHFVLEVQDKLDFKTLYRTKYGWNHMAVPLYNPKGWTRYCRKDFKENEQLNSDLDYSEDSFIDMPPDMMVMPKHKLF